MDRISKIIYGVLALSVIGLVASGVYYASVRSGSPLATVSSPIRYNVFFPQANNKQIRYYNGNTFVAYDTDTHITTPLTKNRMIPDVSAAYWLSGGVAFRVTSINPTSDVNGPATAALQGNDGDTLDLSGSLWYLSFSDNSITYLTNYSDNVAISNVVSNDAFLYADSANTFALLHSNGKIDQAAIKNSELIHVLSMDSDSYYYTQAFENSFALKKGHFGTSTNETIVDNIYASEKNHSLYDPMVMRGSHIYFLDSSSGVGRLLSFSVDTKKTTSLVEPFSGEISANADGSVTGYSFGKKNIRFVSLADGALGHTVVASLPYTSPVSFITINNGFYFTDVYGSLSRVDQNSSVATSSPAGYHEPLETVVSIDSVAIERSVNTGNDNAYTVTFIDGSVSGMLDTLYGAVTAKKLDPYQFTFDLNPGPNVVY